ncbi:MAG: hypothetical protein QXG05_08095, partial [Nitrososphaerota archaeon]
MDPPPKRLQIYTIRRIFTALNPDVSPDVIDWDAVIDDTLGIRENINNLAKLYPMYKWRAEQPLDELLEQISNEVSVLRQFFSDREIIDMFEALGFDLQRPTARGLAQARQEIEKLRREREELDRRLAALQQSRPESLRERLVQYINNRAIQMDLSTDDIQLLTSLIDETKSYEYNIRRIDDEITDIMQRAARAAAIAPPNPPSTAETRVTQLRGGRPGEVRIELTS